MAVPTANVYICYANTRQIGHVFCTQSAVWSVEIQLSVLNLTLTHARDNLISTDLTAPCTKRLHAAST